MAHPLKRSYVTKQGVFLMEKKNLIPQAAKPVVRVTSGTQSNLLAELNEEVLSGTPGVTPHWTSYAQDDKAECSYDDAE
jgi:bacteriocin leader peptide (microcyclamide/patellamide family)